MPRKWARLTVKKSSVGWKIHRGKTVYPTMYRTKALALRKKQIMEEWFLNRKR